MYPYNIKTEAKREIASQETEQKDDSLKESQNTYDSSVLDMLKSCMQLASDASEYFNQFAAQISDISDKELILKMYLNKCKASKILSEIYSRITGERLASPSASEPDFSDNISENAQFEMLSEIENIDYFRALLFSLLSVGYRDMLYEIITDMQSNAQILIYIFCKYK